MADRQPLDYAGHGAQTPEGTVWLRVVLRVALLLAVVAVLLAVFLYSFGHSLQFTSP